MHFAHPAPAGIADYEAILGVPARFGAASYSVRFPTAALDVPLSTADPDVCAALEQNAERLLSRLPRAGLFSERVRARIGVEIHGGDPRAERVAFVLRTSARTLKRRLQREGTTFRALLDEVRRDLVLSRVRAGEIAADAAASLAGFSEASAFRRAFKRWTGQSFAAYRFAAEWPVPSASLASAARRRESA